MCDLRHTGMPLPCSQHQRCALQFRLGCDPARPGPWHASSWQPAVCSASPSCPAAAAAPASASPSVPTPHTHSFIQPIVCAADDCWVVLPASKASCIRREPGLPGSDRHYLSVQGSARARPLRTQGLCAGYATGQCRMCNTACTKVAVPTGVKKGIAGCAKGQ